MTFENFTKKNFNGNTEKALECLAKEGYSRKFEKSKSPYEFKQMIDSLPRDLASRYMVYLNAEVAKDPRRMNQEVKMAVSGVFLKMTYDEVKNAKENPFKAKLHKDLLILLLAGIGFLSTALLAPGIALNPFALKASSIVGGIMAMNVMTDVYKYFKFKSLKKMILEEDKDRYNDQGNKNNIEERVL